MKRNHFLLLISAFGIMCAIEDVHRFPYLALGFAATAGAWLHVWWTGK